MESPTIEISPEKAPLREREEHRSPTESKPGIIQVITAEFTSLRSELIQKHSNLINLLSIYLALLGGSYGAMVTKDLYDGILLIPLAAAALFARYLQDSAVISAISAYIHDEIEARKIPAALGYVPTKDGCEELHQRLWQSWSHYYNWRFGRAFPIYKVPLFVIYFILSIVPAVVFAAVNLHYIRHGHTGMTRIPIDIAGYVMGWSLVGSILAGGFIIIGLFAPSFWVNTENKTILPARDIMSPHKHANSGKGKD